MVKRAKKSATPKRKAQFSNATFSDELPANPKLGNRGLRPKTPIPATSGMTGRTGQADYFREQPKADLRQLQTTPDATINPDRVTLSVRMRFNPIRGLTAERLTGALEQWQLGFFREAGILWDMMERRDYQMKIVAPKRKKAVARHGYDVLTVDEVPDGMDTLATQQQEFLKYFWDRISVTTAVEADENGGFALLVRQMMDAIGKRYAVHEIIWQPDAAGNLTAKFIHCPIWWFEGTRGKLRYLQSEFQVYGVDMNPGDWLVTVHDGIMEACSLVYLFKWLPLKSWLGLMDKFGQPGIHGKTDAPPGSAEFLQFVDAVKDFAENWGAVTNRSGEINLVEAKTSSGGENMFSQIVEKMDKALTILWRGADLGTSSKHNSQGASLQEDETEILETDDSRIVEETLTSQVSRIALAWKFGEDAPALAYLKIRVPEEKNITQDIAVDELLTSLGGELGLKETYERYGREIPKDGEDTLKAPAPAAPDPGADLEPANPAKKVQGAEIANARTAPGLSDKFASNAAADVGAALGPDAATINARFAALLKISDPIIFLQRATALQQWLADNEEHFLNNPALADALHQIQITAFGNGLAAKRASS